MSKMQEIRAAAAAKLAAAKASIQPAPVKPAKPVIRVRAGGTVTEAMIKVALGIPTAAQKLVSWAQARRSDFVVGAPCRQCHGVGRLRFVSNPNRIEKCYKCHGKGVISQRDIDFLDHRMRGNGPICWVIGAPAA